MNALDLSINKLYHFVVQFAPYRVSENLTYPSVCGVHFRV